MRLQGIRAITDVRDETIKYKIRDAIEKKVPFIGVIGDREMQGNAIAVRKRGEQKAESMSIDAFVKVLQQLSVDKQ